MFLFAGLHKLTGAADDGRRCSASIGLGQWFRYLTGAIEVVVGGAAAGSVAARSWRRGARRHDGRRR